MKYSSKIYALSLLEAWEKKPESGTASGSTSLTTRNFLALVRKNGDFSKLPKILFDFKKLYNKKHGIKEVKIRLAREEKSVVNQVKEILNLKHEPEVSVEKDILGGAVVTIDDEIIIDGSVNTRIQKLF